MCCKASQFPHTRHSVRMQCALPAARALVDKHIKSYSAAAVHAHDISDDSKQGAHILQLWHMCRGVRVSRIQAAAHMHWHSASSHADSCTTMHGDSQGTPM